MQERDTIILMDKCESDEDPVGQSDESKVGSFRGSLANSSYSSTSTISRIVQVRLSLLLY